MTLVVYDRVKETTTTTGTGTITLAGAVTGYQSFAVVGNGNTTYYCIAGRGTNEWEVGIGTYTAVGTTLARTTILASSNANTVVNFSAGTKDVFVTPPAGKYIGTDGGTLTGNLLFAQQASPYTYYIQFGDNTGWKLRYMTSVSGTPTERFSFTDTGAFNAVGAITQNDSQVLTAANFTSYAPALANTVLTENGLSRSNNAGNLDTLTSTGFWRGSNMTGAPDTGWWYVTVESHDINGSSGWVKQRATAYGAGNSYAAGTTLTRVRQGGTSWGTWIVELDSSNYTSYAYPSTPASGFSTPAGGVNGATHGWMALDGYGSAVPNYGGTDWWVGVWTGGDANRGIQIAGGYSDSDLYFRKGSSTWGSWIRVLNSSNYTSYSPSLTGYGASGNWGISVSGNAHALSNDGYGNGQLTWYQTSGNFQTWTGGWASHLISNHGDGATYYNQILIMPFWGPPQYMRKEGGTNVGPYAFLTTENYTSYSPSLTGTGASGSWNISVTGSAANATTANNVFGGAANQIPYQTAANTTSFVTAPTTASTFLQWNGTAFTWAAAGGGITQRSQQSTTSGTTKIYTGIPSTVKRITVMLNNVSTTGTSPFIVQLGTSDGFVTSGYSSTGTGATSGVSSGTTTVGFYAVQNPAGGGSGAAAAFTGAMTITNLSGNVFVHTSMFGQEGVGYTQWAAGKINLGGTITQLQLTTVGGTDTFDSGTINILYE